MTARPPLPSSASAGVSTHPAPVQCLRKSERDRSSSGDSWPEQDIETDSREDRALLCRACGFTVTSSEQAVEIEGNHLHTFFNPAGIIFEIACFADAPGCLILGQASTYFAWFKGHSWCYTVCDSCQTHLGWSFRSEQGDYFFGLIRNRLIDA